MTTTYPTTAPSKALTTSEQRNLKALIENDYKRARHALAVALVEQRLKIDEEANELFPEELIGVARTELADRMNSLQREWEVQYATLRSNYPQLRIAPNYRYTAEKDEVPALQTPDLYIGYPGKEKWIEEQQAMAQKAFDEASSVLAAQELEAQRTVLVRGVGSQEALNVLLEIPAATDLFTNRVLELEQAPAATDD